MSAPALKRYRVVVIEWLTHDAVIEAEDEILAEDEADGSGPTMPSISCSASAIQASTESRSRRLLRKLRCSRRIHRPAGISFSASNPAVYSCGGRVISWRPPRHIFLDRRLRSRNRSRQPHGEIRRSRFPRSLSARAPSFRARPARARPTPSTAFLRPRTAARTLSFHLKRMITPSAPSAS
jgi:hypothetical protein